MSSFQYTRLADAEQSIRLITLKGKDKSSRNKNVSCDISVVPFKNSPPYVALSYAWGDPKDTVEILLNETLISVTRNLHSALLHLRLNVDRLLWIDALCINQQDDEEKSKQIQLMGSIYEAAQHVTVWLGPADETSDRVIDYLNELGQEAMTCEIDISYGVMRDVWLRLAAAPLNHRDTGYTPEGGKMVYTIEVDNRQDTKVAHHLISKLYYRLSDRHDASLLCPVDGMTTFFQRSWWSRIWILQEFARAKAAGFVCGTKKLSRRRCDAALHAFQIFVDVLMVSSQYAAPMVGYQLAVTEAAFANRATVVMGTRSLIARRPLSLMKLLWTTYLDDGNV